VIGSLRTATGYVKAAPQVLRGLIASGTVAPIRPDKLLGMLAGVGRSGLTIAMAAATGAARYPDRDALIDERGRLTFAQLDVQSSRIAAALRSDHGLALGHRVGILCRNHRGFVTAIAAVSRTGADMVLLNTDAAAPQLARTLDSEGVQTLITDDEFRPAVRASGFTGTCVLAWTDGPEPGEAGTATEATLDDLARRGGPAMRWPARQGRIVIMTSGTTGAPRGAGRRVGPLAAVTLMAGMLARVPVRSGEPMVVCPPVYHALGLVFLLLGLFVGAPVVLHRRFDPAEAIDAVERHRAGSLVAVPVMLQRMLAGDVSAERRDTGSLRAVISGGSALRPELATAFMDTFGEILHNLYGSSEAAWGSLATPDQLRRAPGTVGTPPPGGTVKILDAAGNELPAGQTGRVFIGNSLRFDGYTGGGLNPVCGPVATGDGSRSVATGDRNQPVATGDLGHFDNDGLLFIDGRDDDMIVSGGENVFPQEVEDILATHGSVADAAAVGVPDEQFGQRLVAFVVRRPGVEVSADELREHVRANLARFKVPREVHFVDELPRGATGKIRRNNLRARL
jgi:fatty-acyl-CoA synthase